MALSETIEYDKIEVVGQYKSVQVRKATVIKKDGVELTRTYERYVLSLGELDVSFNLVRRCKKFHVRTQRCRDRILVGPSGISHRKRSESSFSPRRVHLANR